MTSPPSLYAKNMQPLEKMLFMNQNDSSGFINLFGLPITVKAKMIEKLKKGDK